MSFLQSQLLPYTPQTLIKSTSSLFSAPWEIKLSSAADCFQVMERAGAEPSLLKLGMNPGWILFWEGAPVWPRTLADLTNLTNCQINSKFITATSARLTVLLGQPVGTRNELVLLKHNPVWKPYGKRGKLRDGGSWGAGLPRLHHGPFCVSCVPMTQFYQELVSSS